MSAETDRHIVVAVDLSDQSLKAVQYTAYEVCRPGDVVHLVHVAKVLSPQYTIQHNFPGSSYNIPNTHPIDEEEHIHHVREIIRARFSSDLDQHKIPHSLHIFLDTDNAPASAVCASIFKIANDYAAAMILMACHNKAYGWDTLFLGSVADHATEHSTYPIMVIRDFTPPRACPQPPSLPATAAVAASTSPPPPLNGLATASSPTLVIASHSKHVTP